MYSVPKLLACTLLALITPSADGKMTDASYFYRADRPMIIAHRGSHGHFPEHSLGGYADAYYSGADFIEIDM
jgi:glycerophosphoryl diester phosphodiesterase